MEITVEQLTQELEALRRRRADFQQTEQAAIDALMQQARQRAEVANVVIREMNAHEATLLRQLEGLALGDANGD